MSKYLLCLLLLLTSTISYGEVITHELSVKNIIVGKPFELQFRVKDIGKSFPEIRFNPSSALEVIERKKNDVSINSKVVNGNIVTRRDGIIKYLIVPNRSGFQTIKEIKVVNRGVSLKYKNIRIKVLKTIPKLKKIFVQAEVDKTSAYKGEVVRVDYYLYNSVPVTVYDIKKFPKFNRFLKKNIKISDQGKTVDLNGTVYRKTLKYSVKLFPQVAGELTIGSIRMSVRYRDIGRATGFSRLRVKSATTTSIPIKLHVKSLPKDGLPTDFTGLVGSYDFKLTVPKKKLIVNDPMDITLTVIGDGLLEGYEPPVIYSDASLESFDSSSEQIDRSDNIVERLFTQTYMARSELNITAREITQSYFDPQSSTYVTKTILVPSITALGGSSSKFNKTTSKIPENRGDKLKSIAVVEPQITQQNSVVLLLGPVFSDWNFKGFSISRVIQLSLLFLFIVLIIPLFKRRKSTKEISQDVIDLNRLLKKNGFNYSLLHKLVFYVEGSDKFSSPEQVIMSIDISNEAREYFIGLLKKSETSEYGIVRNRSTNEYLYKQKFYNELMVHTRVN